MAEQRPWWKLWVSALSDDDLEALSLEDWARWARLGAHLKLHGEGGAMVCRRPGRALAKLWRTSGGPRGWSALLAVAHRLPGITVTVIEKGDGPEPEAVRIAMRNWRKYQEDNSADRTRRWREKQRRRDGQPPSPVTPDERHGSQSGDASPPSRCDDVDEIRSRRESPLPPVSPTANRDVQPLFDWPSPQVKAASARGETGWLPGRLPYEAFHHDCPERPWRGQCVRSDYAATHPGAYPALGNGVPKQCPTHREEKPSW